MENIFRLKNISLKEISILIIISLHIFFWDIKLIGQYGFRESILIILFFLVNDFFKGKFYRSKENLKKISIILIFLLLLTFHLIANISIDDGIFFRENILGLAGIYLLSAVIFFYYDLIIENLNFIINFFLISFFLGFFISDYKFLTEWELYYSGICFGKLKIKHFIFAENSHLGMMLGGVLGYFVMYCINQILKNFLFKIINSVSLKSL